MCSLVIALQKVKINCGLYGYSDVMHCIEFQQLIVFYSYWQTDGESWDS